MKRLASSNHFRKYNMDHSNNLITILHLDDDKLFLSLSKALLNKIEKNLVVHIVSNPELALQILERQEYDVIISDYQMNGLNGLEFLEKVRRRGIKSLFIVLTGRGGEKVMSSAFKLGADFYLQKKGKMKDIFSEIHHFISRSSKTVKKTQRNVK
ncbi:MAG: response regulator [Candidatus Hodarchaeales archaeon]|jgi:DNA-binding NarL/FixJ family response regulator